MKEYSPGYYGGCRGGLKYKSWRRKFNVNTTILKIPLQVFVLASLCCMLCSCRTNNGLWEQSDQPEKSPQQILEEQPVDDTHDAFLVSTGGRLGTLLVTAELAEENKSEFGTRDITFSVWNPAEMDRPMQTFSEEFMMGVAPEFHHAADANFDGYQDFGYLFHAGNQPNYWRYWLWSEEQGQFIYYAPLIEVSQPVFDADRQVVTGWARGSAASGVHTIYRWIDGELTLVRRIDTHYPNLDDDTQLATVEDWIDGQMVEVYRKEWDLTKIREDTPLVDWKWYDLEYYGEPE